MNKSVTPHSKLLVSTASHFESSCKERDLSFPQGVRPRHRWCTSPPLDFFRRRISLSALASRSPVETLILAIMAAVTSASGSYHSTDFAHSEDFVRSRGGLLRIRKNIDHIQFMLKTLLNSKRNCEQRMYDKFKFTTP